MTTQSNQKRKPPVICFGEVLWDCLPKGLFLGGAPFSVAVHLQRLGQNPLMVTAVGDDFLGEEILDRSHSFQLDTQYVAKVKERTGAVKVHLDGNGNASYEFVSPVAWDVIPLPETMLDTVKNAAALVHGSLALRSSSNEKLLQQMLDSFSGPVCFDVNLRPPHDDVQKVLKFARYSSLLKLNDDELYQLAGLDRKTDLRDAMEALRDQTEVERICVTRGGEGAAFLAGNIWLEGDVPPVTVRDTVGAGDAFMGAFVAGWLDTVSSPQWENILQRALALGAKVASEDGAQPDYEPENYKVNDNGKKSK